MITHTVWIPALHRDLTAGLETVQVTGATVGQLVDELEQRFPGIQARLTVEGALRPGIAVAVDGVIVRRGLRQRLDEPSEVHFIPAMSGGR